MADIDVVPTEFRNVEFTADQIRGVVARLLVEAGLVDHPGIGSVRIEVDESTPLSKVVTQSLEPLVICAQSGALEDRRRTRHFGGDEAADALGRAVFAAADRLDPTFDGPAFDADVGVAHAVAWDCHVVGRMARLGHRPQRQRRLYSFELRHGFSDATVAAFDRLWSAERLTWAEIVAISDDARSVVGAA
ncbi:MAG: hypothetical protein JJE52_04595 [Acidimicrobiia bacterium]|nr:hypothetical protein [Acidimicrobiia bacterium]